MNEQSPPGGLREGAVKARRSGVIVKLIILAACFVVVMGVSVWLVASFLNQPTKVVVLTPEVAAEAKAAAPAAPRAAAPRPAGKKSGFSGKVVDAATNQPVKKFIVHIGYSFNSGQPPQYNQAGQAFTGGRYAMTIPNRYPGYFVRIEAPGYLPAVSPEMMAIGTADFELTAGKDVQGRVLSADGTPAAKAVVISAAFGMQVYLQGNATNVADRGYTTAITDAKGKFDLPPEDERFIIVAFNDVGYAQADQTAFAASSDIRLAAYGRLDGQYFLGTQAAADKQLQLQVVSGNSSQGDPSIYNTLRATTGTNGSFSFENVPPGVAQITRRLSQPITGGSIGMVQMLFMTPVSSGKTSTINIGGVGRPVVGRVVYPASMGNSMDYYIKDDVTGTKLPPPPPQMPENVKNGSQMTRQVWMQIFSMTAAGRAYLATQPTFIGGPRHYQMEFDKDHKFRIENVVPGDYQITIGPQSIRGGKYIQPVTAEFTMPDVPGGVSDEPLVIPDIQLNGN